MAKSLKSHLIFALKIGLTLTKKRLAGFHTSKKKYMVSLSQSFILFNFLNPWLKYGVKL